MTSTGVPRVQLLSNGNYSVMITDAASGYSRWRDLAITRWSADPTCDADGAFIFLRDVVAGDVWSVGAQPIGIASDDYAVLYPDRTLRAPEDVLARRVGGQEVLWSLGISGDRPIALVVNDGDAKAVVARQLIRAHEYWQTKGVAADLVILSDAATYDAPSLEALRATLAAP